MISGAKMKLLQNAPHTAWHKLGYKCWHRRNRWPCWKKYRDYARRKPGPANSYATFWATKEM